MRKHFPFILKMEKSWKHNGLLDDKGILRPEKDVWSEHNITRFEVAFIDNPDTTGQSFYEKLEKQLAYESLSVHEYVIELLYLYFSATCNISFNSKMNRLKMVASWKGIDLDSIVETKLTPLKIGLAKTGGRFNTNIYNEIKMLHIFVKKLKRYPLQERKNILSDPKKLKSLTEESREAIEFRAQMQHIIQSYLLPTYFEWVTSWGNKRSIVETYKHLIQDKKSSDLDEQIYHIKHQLKV